MTDQIEHDWESRHQTEQMKSVKGKEMNIEDFWRSGEIRYSEIIRPLFSTYRNDIENMVVLEIGCGPGRLLKPFAKRAKKAIGVDVSHTAIKTIKNNLSAFDNVVLIKNNGKNLEKIMNETIDLVISFDVFQHIPSLEIQTSYLK